MSKGRVWNKGKRNGGGGPPISAIPAVPQVVVGTGPIKPEDSENLVDQINSTVLVERVEQVKPVNRTNWVTRPARIKREK